MVISFRLPALTSISSSGAFETEPYSHIVETCHRLPSPPGGREMPLLYRLGGDAVEIIVAARLAHAHGGGTPVHSHQDPKQHCSFPSRPPCRARIGGQRPRAVAGTRVSPCAPSVTGGTPRARASNASISRACDLAFPAMGDGYGDGAFQGLSRCCGRVCVGRCRRRYGSGLHRFRLRGRGLAGNWLECSPRFGIFCRSGSWRRRT